jgi:miniconductance mechanosensitive channel
MLEQVTALVEAYPWLAAVIGYVLLALACYLSFLLTRLTAVTIVERVVSKTAFTWDDVFRDNKVFSRAAELAPAAAAYYGVLLIPNVHQHLVELTQRIAAAGAVAVLIVAINAVLRSANQIYEATPMAKARPIKGYVQIGQIFLFSAGAIIFVAALLGKSPWLFMSGIGAMTAVLMLVFKDTILSLVASVQLTSNDMIRVGDWIEVPNQNADGDVIDIALHTVKVQNWDKTVTTIPTYTLISQGFKNWRTMPLSGGRRIKRAVYVDMTSVRHLTGEEILNYERFALLREYMTRKKQELAEYNAKVDPSYVANARRLTNVGTFRAYVEAYLRNHPGVHQEMTLIVRQLAPTPTGLPIEVYAFTNQTAWGVYEGIQSDIFDHILAIAPEFGLQVYQQPSGADVRQLASAKVGV